MVDAFAQAWEDLFGRVDGPMSARLIIQPLMATFLAIRAGWADAREGRGIFFWTLARYPAQTRVMLKNMWRIAGKVFFVAVVLDLIYQITVLHSIHPLQTLIVAIVLALVPCVIVRGIGNRIVSMSRQRELTQKDGQTDTAPAPIHREDQTRSSDERRQPGKDDRAPS